MSPSILMELFGASVMTKGVWPNDEAASMTRNNKENRLDLVMAPLLSAATITVRPAGSVGAIENASGRSYIGRTRNVTKPMATVKRIRRRIQLFHASSFRS
jgi:hypothetical protein